MGSRKHSQSGTKPRFPLTRSDTRVLEAALCTWQNELDYHGIEELRRYHRFLRPSDADVDLQALRQRLALPGRNDNHT